MLEWDPGWLISDKWCQSSVEVRTLILYRTIGGKEIHFIQTNNSSKGHCVELAFVDLLLHDISNLYIFLFFFLHRCLYFRLEDNRTSDIVQLTWSSSIKTHFIGIFLMKQIRNAYINSVMLTYKMRLKA